MADKQSDIKIVTIGDGAVGKTSFLYVYAKKKFPEDYIPTVYDDYTAESDFEGKKIIMSLWDTAGQEEYDAIRPLSYDNTNIFLIAFSTTLKETLFSIKTKWLPELNAYYKDKGKVPMLMLVGTKMDLRDQKPNSPDNCTDSEIQGIVNEIGAVGYVLCSAKLNQNIDKVFQEALRYYFEKKPESSGGCCNIL